MAGSFISTALEAKASVAAGAAQDVNPRSSLVLGLSGTFVGTVKFQWSPLASGDLWFDIGSAMTAAGFVRLPAGRARRVRANTTAYTSGTPVANLFHDKCLSALNTERAFFEESMEAKASVAAGAALDLLDGESALFVLSGTFVGTVQLQISLTEEGSDWFNWGPALSAPGSVWLPAGMAARIRANTTAYTSGTPVATASRGFVQETTDDQLIETVTSGALSLHTRTSLISVTGTQAYSLANGLYEGQRKSLRVIVAASTPDGTLTPATFADGTSLDLDAVDESVELEWHALGGWRVVHLIGATIT